MDPVQITVLGVAVALAALIVTLNGSLRRDIDKRFDRVDERFDAIDKRIDGIEKRFDDRFDGTEKHFGDRFDGIDARLRSVEQGLAEVRGRFASMESYILGRTGTPAREASAE